MAKCHRFVISLSVGLNILLLVFGVLMIAVGFSYDADDQTPPESAKWSRGHGILVLRIFGPINVVLSVLGICASVKDVKALLILYSTVMFVAFVALMVVASPLIQDQAKMDSELEARFRNMTPLYEADPQVQTELYKLQASDHCCGLTSHADWMDKIPASCLCVNSSTEEPCVRVIEQPPSIWVYKKPCGPILKRYQSVLIKVNIGVISAFVTVMLTAMVVSLVLGLEEYWTTPPVEITVDDNDRVKYQPKPYAGIMQ